MALRVEGHVGELRVGYQIAAELGAWRLELAPQLPRQYAICAVMRTVSEYWLTQRPLTLALVVGSDIWTWTPVEPGMDGVSLSIAVAGAPIVCRGAAQQEERGA